MQHDHEHSQGGFWIAPNGTSHPVSEMEGHNGVIWDLGYPSYGAAYKAGYLRISTCDYNDAAFSVTFSDLDVTVQALRSAVEIARHQARNRPHSEWAWESVLLVRNPDYPEYLDDQTLESRLYHTRTSEDAADRLARDLMQIALRKNAEARQAAYA